MALYTPFLIIHISESSWSKCPLNYLFHNVTFLYMNIKISFRAFDVINECITAVIISGMMFVQDFVEMQHLYLPIFSAFDSKGTNMPSSSSI